MSVRVIASGKDFMCFVRSGDVGSYVYKPIAGQTNCSLSRDDGENESNAKNLNGWKDFFKSLKEWTATVEIQVTDQSDTNTDEINFEALQDYEEAGTKPTFVFAWVLPQTTPQATVDVDKSKRMYVGVGLVKCPLTANSGELATSSVAIRGCLKLDIIDPT